jgi:hypothetical protein
VPGLLSAPEGTAEGVAEGGVGVGLGACAGPVGGASLAAGGAESRPPGRRFSRGGLDALARGLREPLGRGEPEGRTAAADPPAPPGSAGTAPGDTPPAAPPSGVPGTSACRAGGCEVGTPGCRSGAMGGFFGRGSGVIPDTHA